MTLLNNNPELTQYQLVLYSRTRNEEIPLLVERDSIVTRIQISERVNTPDVRVKVNMRASNVTDFINAGDELRLFVPVLEMNGNIHQMYKHKTKVLAIRLKDDSNEIILDSHNLGYQLNRNDFFVMIKDKETTSDFIRRTADTAKVPIDERNFINTEYQHPARSYNKSSLYEVWQTLIINTMYKEEKPYYLQVTPIGIQLIDLDDEDLSGTWIFEHNSIYANLIGAEREISIKDKKFANRVEPKMDPKTLTYAQGIIGSSTDEFLTAVNQESIDQYGLFTSYIDVSNVDKIPEMIERMRLIVAKAVPSDRVTFRTYAINSLKPTDKIMVLSDNLRTAGFYYIEDINTSIAVNNYWHNIVCIKYRNIPDLLKRDLERSVKVDGYALQILEANKPEE